MTSAHIAAANAEGVEQTNVKVMVRIRPFNTREIALTEGGIEAIRSVLIADGSSVRVLDHQNNWAEKPEGFAFDHVLWSIPSSQNQITTSPFATQEDVFVVTGKPAVENALQGFHNTIFAYGQTGSGKTHSMLGSIDDEGIAPRVVRYLFQKIADQKRDALLEQVQFHVELSFIEIYNDKAKDLLLVAEKKQGRSNQTDSSYAECRVRYNPEKGTYVDGLTRMPIHDEEQCLNAIRAGMEHRATAATKMNDTSSRSHAIFQICLTQKMILKGTTRVSVINLVDLAGSERIGMSGVQGSALTEAKNINQSLTTLRRVIDVLIENSKLKKGQRPSVPPFRESLLTWILSDSLGGNSKTMMLAAVSPYLGNVDDTQNTLRYALKAKDIVCNASVNEGKVNSQANSMRQEMESLRQQLIQAHEAKRLEEERVKENIRKADEEAETLRAETAAFEAQKVALERELADTEQALEDAREKMMGMGNVEEEEYLAMQRLEEARAHHAELVKRLDLQRADRIAKETERDEIMARYRDLVENHAKQEEEEAKAKLAAEQSRLRQFASAFHNAFILGKQKSGLIELNNTAAELKQQLDAKEVIRVQKEQELRRLQAEKIKLRRQAEVSEKRAKDIFAEIQSVLASKEAKTLEAKTRRDEAQRRLAEAQDAVEQRRHALAAERIAHDLRRNDVRLGIAKLELELKKRQDIQAALEAKRAKTEAETAKATDEADELEASRKEKMAELSRLKQQNAEVSLEIQSLRQEKADLQEACSQSANRLEDDHREASEVKERCRELEAKIAKLGAEHEELRRYVSAKFFPAQLRTQ